MDKLENKFFYNYKGLRFGIITSYIVCFLPLIAALLGLFPYLLTGNTSVIGLIGGQFYWLLPTIPILFLSIDLYAIITKQREHRSFKETIKNSPELFVLLLFLVWSIITVILQIVIYGNSKALTSIVRPFFVQEGLMLFCYYALIVCAAFFVKDKKTTKNLICITLVISVVLAAFMVIDPTGTIWFQKENNTFWASMFINSNHYGYHLTITVMLAATLFCLSKKTYLKWIWGIVFTILCMALMFNDTLGSLLAVFASLILLIVVLSWFKGKIKLKYFVPLFIFIAASFVCYFLAKSVDSTYHKASFFEQIINLFKELLNIAQAPTSEVAKQSGSSRWELWLQALDEIAYSPLIGTGNVLLRPHNEYLQYGQVFGIPALIIYLAAFVIIMVKAIKYRKNLSGLTLVLLMAVIAYLIGAFFGNTMPHTMPLFCLCVGLLIRWLNEDIITAKQGNLKANLKEI